MNSIIDIPYSSDELIKAKISRFSYHAFFYYLLSHCDNIRLSLCQMMNPERKIAYTKVDIPIFPGDNEMMKSSIMDIVAVDDIDDIYNLEMQNYQIDERQITRFLIYGGVLLRSPTKKSTKDYNGIGTFHQMLSNNTKDVEGLHHFHHNFISYDPLHNVKQPYNKNDLHLFQLKHLNEIKEQNEELYALLYLFQNDRPCDTIKIGNLVKEVVDMHDAYVDSRAFWEAFIQEQNELQANTLRNAAVEQGKKQGEKLGKKLGIRAGHIDILTEIGMDKFHEDIRYWLEGLDEKQLENVRKYIFKAKTLEELKEEINR